MNEELRSIIANPLVKFGITISIVLIAVLLAVKTASLMRSYTFIGGGVSVTNTVTLSGSGEVFAVPDVATFSFSVLEENSIVSDAQEIATEKINKLIDYLKQEGVEEKDIKTISYNVNPRYEYRKITEVEIARAIYPPQPPSQERVLVGFEVNQRVEVKVRDTAKAGELLSGVGGLGVSDISGLSFTIDDEEDLKREARKKAIKEAEEKAKQLAQDLNVKIIRVVSFSESGQGYQPRFAFTEGIGGSFDQDVSVSSAPEIPVGENKIVSNVSITYEIR